MNSGESASCSANNPEGSTTKPGFDISTSDFGEVVKTPWFVDKSLFIEKILRGDTARIITAPRRFGKSTNMDMLKKFVEIQIDENGKPIDELELSPNYKIFKENNLQIMQHEWLFKKHFGQYPVIHADFKTLRCESFEDFLNSFKDVLCKTFGQHPYLLNSNSLDSSQKEIFNKYYDKIKSKTLTKFNAQRGLEFLSRMLHRHYNKRAYVLIDEFDALLNEILFSRNISDEDIDMIFYFIFDSLLGLLKGNEHVTMSLINAYSIVARLLTYSVNNNQLEPALQSPTFCKFYGLTGEEVVKLLEKNNLSENLKEVKDWYNGYRVKWTDNLVEIYNTWSIVNYINEKKVGNYWTDQSLDRLKNILSHEQIQNKFKELTDTDEKAIRICYRRAEPSDIHLLRKLINTPPKKLYGDEVYFFIQFLYQNGYFNGFLFKNENHAKLKLKIPNREIYNEFQKYLP